MTYIVTGYYGSGKTEFVLNLALALAAEKVTIADLDIINPFFRSRERANALASLGIEVTGSVFESHVAQDVPALSFAFLSRIRAGENVIIDLPGGEGGLRLLSGCYDAIDPARCQFLCVFNKYRPETDSADKMIGFCKNINAASPLPITGLVNNGNLLAYTTAEHVLESQKMVLAACRELGLLLKYTLVQEDIYAAIALSIESEHVLTFSAPQMRKSWQM